jgi:hypothetical protein
LFHVAVAVAQVLPLHCASYVLYEYVFVVASVWAGAVYVLFVSFEISVVHASSLYHWYVNVVSHGSLTFAVNVIELHSFAVQLMLFAVGATFFHVAVFTVLHVPLHCASVTFT